jgi:hypothetical protein
MQQSARTPTDDSNPGLSAREDSVNPEATPIHADNLERTYDRLVELWTSGVRDYHSLLSDYLTANSIFVAVIGFLVARQPVTLLFTLLILLLCVFGLLMTLQMGIVLGRFSAQNGLWEWKLRGIERMAPWMQPKLFLDLHRFRHEKASLEDRMNEPPAFHPNWAVRQQRQWWARRAISFPLFFGSVYGLFFLWGVIQLVG